jgi:formylglycine-generating enzyme required for sulfatase activity
MAGGRRVPRGGAFADLPWGARCAYRNHVIPDLRFNLIGFRVVVSPFFSDR